MARVLVVDDEPKLGGVVAQMLELDGHAVVRAGGGCEALVRLGEERFDVVVTDLRMPEVDGLVVLRAVRALSPAPEVVLMTAYGTAESAVEAMKSGAADYVTKPFAMDELRLRVGRLAAQGAAEAQRSRLVARLTPDLVAESAAMKAVLEAELFGHEKGAFTGAAQRKAGHLAAADGGTLFLDEIGEITPATQVKLLRFLQDRTFVPVGSTGTRAVDVRVISATNRDLDEAVRAGAFREDFFYRLNVFAIRVPPIRDRREDVGPIAERFLAARGLPSAKLSSEARAALLAHDWPGNVRELENALERALIVAGEEELRPEHLAVGPASRGRPRDAAALVGEGFDLDAFERELLLAALARAGGNKTRAASFFGITRRRLYSLLASSGGEPDDEPAR